MLQRKSVLLLLLPALAVGLVVYACLTPEPQETTAVKIKPLQEHYDVIVVGGDPEGIAAAVTAAREGLHTLLVDKRGKLGGLFTVGWLNTLDLSYDPEGQILNRGLFLEFYQQIEGDSFDVRTAANVFHKMVNELDNLTVVLDVCELIPMLNENCVVGLRFVHDGEQHTVYSHFTIDATQDADIAAAAGVPYTVGGEDYGDPKTGMAATAVFKLEGVSWYRWLKLRLAVKLKGEAYTGSSKRSVWGFPELLSDYQSNQPGVQLRGLNIGRQNDGTVLVNALQLFNVDPFSQESRRKAKEKALRELEHIVPYLRENIPGFEKVRLVDIAEELYIRESRHIIGEYRLTIDDVLENRDFYDRIAYGSYPVDIQASRPGEFGLVIGNPEQYAIPYRCLVPKRIDGLLVVGRSASYDSLAHGSARVVPVGMNTGQAAGAACAVALREGVSLRRIAYDSNLVEKLQQLLNKQGMDLKPFSLTPEIAKHPCYSGLRFVRSYGLVAGGYTNDYRLDETMSEQQFFNLIRVLSQRANWPLQKEVTVVYEGNALTLGDIAYALYSSLGHSATKRQSLIDLRAQGLWCSEFSRQIDEQSVMTCGQVYLLLLEFDNWVKQTPR